MIIARAPFRMSFVGGGSDLPAFYTKKTGAVVSTAIDKYMYVIINQSFDKRYRVSYSITEIVDDIYKIQHDIVRHALQYMGIRGGLEIVSVSDIPKGSGLGSSSSFAVALLLALHNYKLMTDKGYEKTRLSPGILAEWACRIEIGLCNKPIGKQDQYAAAFGGMNRFDFYRRSVSNTPILLPSEKQLEFHKHLMLFYLESDRSADTILKEQTNNLLSDKYMEITERMTKLTGLFESALQLGRMYDVGQILHEAWKLKRSLSSKISNSKIDEYYEKARNAGAWGGKVLGAGGGGFLLVFAPPEAHYDIIKVLYPLKLHHFGFEPNQAKIVYMDGLNG